MINVIDQDKCIGCGTCFKSCSLDVFRLDTDQSKVSPCMAACPAGTDIRGYNALVQQGKLEEAAQKLRQANPFPGITGRICFHPCEKECARNAVDGAVNINAVEQFLGDVQIFLERHGGAIPHMRLECRLLASCHLIGLNARAEDAPTHPDTAWRSGRCAGRW